MTVNPPGGDVALAGVPPQERCECEHVPSTIPGMLEVKKKE
nr:uncharacterized protein CI109_004879 [Kwoniella shandongensis]KAA5526676.1 hypothetical protein CI109_004879 [Kwoniella shandongensis]